MFFPSIERTVPLGEVSPFEPLGGCFFISSLLPSGFIDGGWLWGWTCVHASGSCAGLVIAAFWLSAPGQHPRSLEYFRGCQWNGISCPACPCHQQEAFLEILQRKVKPELIRNLNKGACECREKRDFTLWLYGGRQWGFSAPHLISE